MSQRLIPTGEQSGLQTHIATTESVSLCERDEKLTALWNSNQRSIEIDHNPPSS